MHSLIVIASIVWFVAGKAVVWVVFPLLVDVIDLVQLVFGFFRGRVYH